MKAELSLHQLESHSANLVGSPLGSAKLGSIHAVSVDFGTSIDVADDNIALLPHAGNDVVLATSAEDGVTRTIDVTEKVRADWAARATRNSRCQFRLQFDNPKVANVKTDGTNFAATEATVSTTRPRLTVTYQSP